MTTDDAIALARLIAEEEGVRWERSSGEGLADRRALVARAREIADVNGAEIRALIRFRAPTNAKGPGVSPEAM